MASSTARHTPGRRDDLYRLPDGRDKLKAHDVRFLRTCAICGGLADERAAISVKVAYGNKDFVRDLKDGFWHPRCCFEHFGAKFVAELPATEQAKFCLSDIPASLMRELVEQTEDRAAITAAKGGA